MRILYGKKEQIPENYLKKAMALRYKIYNEEGFIQKGKKDDFDKFDLDAIHFVALDGESVVGYVRLLQNMPLLSLYNEEVETIVKNKGFKKAIEFSRFVVEKDKRIKKDSKDNYSFFVSMLVLKAAYNYIVKNKFDSVFVVVNPRHLERYKKFYYFEQYGAQKDYVDVAGNPALLMYQDVKGAVYRAEQRNKSLHEFMLGS